MDDIVANLNYDYNYQIHLFKSAVDNLSVHDKNLAIEWVNKLKTCTSSVQESQLRNDFLYYLVKSCNSGALKSPFNERPPRGPLLNIMNLLPTEMRGVQAGRKDKKKETRKAELFERSPDKGAFLVAQPVPRCGAFCYLAVISKPPEEQ